MNRRSFLKAIGFTAAAGFATPHVAKPAEAMVSEPRAIDFPTGRMSWQDGNITRYRISGPAMAWPGETNTFVDNTLEYSKPPSTTT